MRFVAMAKTGLTPLMISAFVGMTACGSAGTGGSSGPFGSETEDVVAECDVVVVNETSIERHVTIYQDHVGVGSGHDVLSLAWKTVALQPGQEFQFKWTENYSFNWSSAALPAGASYSVSGWSIRRRGRWRSCRPFAKRSTATTSSTTRRSRYSTGCEFG